MNKLIVFAALLLAVLFLSSVEAKRKQVLADQQAYFESKLTDLDKKVEYIVKKFTKHGDYKKLSDEIALQRKLLRNMKRLKPTEKKETARELIRKRLAELLAKQKALLNEEKEEIALKHPEHHKEVAKYRQLLKITLKGRDQFNAKTKACKKH